MYSPRYDLQGSSCRMSRRECCMQSAKRTWPTQLVVTHHIHTFRPASSLHLLWQCRRLQLSMYAPKQEDVVARQVVYVLCPVQQYQLWQDGHRLEVNGEFPKHLQQVIISMQVRHSNSMLDQAGPPCPVQSHSATEQCYCCCCLSASKYKLLCYVADCHILQHTTHVANKSSCTASHPTHTSPAPGQGVSAASAAALLQQLHSNELPASLFLPHLMVC